MRDAIAGLMAWVAAQTGLAAEPPRIAYVPQAELVERAYGPEAPAGASVTALYERDERTIYLNERWDPADLRQRSTVVHELVHHFQECNDVECRCIAEREGQAYGLQVAWLRGQGVDDPHGFLGIDPFTISVASMCPEGE